MLLDSRVWWSRPKARWRRFRAASLHETAKGTAFQPCRVAVLNFFNLLLRAMRGVCFRRSWWKFPATAESRIQGQGSFDSVNRFARSEPVYSAQDDKSKKEWPITFPN